ncbi:glycosyltransferase family 39 protein [Kallotenue papyrolyticum]|uniref:glycosyltransferase family 39 protein n=1 Tax=Kallotenue papyrolyticum TaxID=1325125 RepID=UPI0004786090|nr:glycosyltransferase family 39 protein [Kallotenue papyrolyticum]
MLLALIGLGLLLLAQRFLSHQQLGGLVVSALALGLLAWGAALVMAPPRPDVLPALARTADGARRGALLAALLSAALTWITSAAGVYTALNVSAWLATLMLWLWAWWPAHAAADAAARQQPSRARWLALLTLAALVLLGGWLRFHRLAEVPGEPTSDHAEKLLDIYDLTQGRRPIFFPRNTGREPAQFYFTFALMRLFDLPLRFETLKLGTVLIGTLTIPAIYLFARELAGRTAGLCAAAWFAVADWAISTARMGLRFPYAPLPTALALWLVWRYLRRGDRRDALWCGLVLGLGLHGYISFRIVPLAIVLALLLAPLDRRWRGQERHLLADGALLLGTALLACLPLAHYTLQHPEQVWFRVATRAGSTERSVGDLATALQTFAINNWNALLAFNWRGDSTMVNAVRFAPFLDTVAATALLAGALIVIVQIARWHALRYGLLLAVLPVLLLPSTLSLAFPIENPSVNRLGTAMPVIFTIAALPPAYLVQLAWQAQARALWRTLALVLLSAALALSARANYQRYFIAYDRQYRSFVPNTNEIAAAVRAEQTRSGIALDNVYLLSYPYWLDGRNLALALGDIAWQREHDLTAERPLPPRAGQPMLFVLHPDDHERQAQLLAAFPDGAFRPVASRTPGKRFLLYQVPAARP